MSLAGMKRPSSLRKTPQALTMRYGSWGSMKMRYKAAQELQYDKSCGVDDGTDESSRLASTGLMPLCTPPALQSVFHDWMQRATAVTVKDPFIQRFHQVRCTGGERG